jgi:hypothetical protein
MSWSLGLIMMLQTGGSTEGEEKYVPFSDVYIKSDILSYVIYNEKDCI